MFNLTITAGVARACSCLPDFQKLTQFRKYSTLIVSALVRMDVVGTPKPCNDFIQYNLSTCGCSLVWNRKYFHPLGEVVGHCQYIFVPSCGLRERPQYISSQMIQWGPCGHRSKRCMGFPLRSFLPCTDITGVHPVVAVFMNTPPIELLQRLFPGFLLP